MGLLSGRQSTTLLSLPQECRRLIFAYVFSETSVFVYDSDSSILISPGKQCQASVLRVSKQFNGEAGNALSDALTVFVNVDPNCWSGDLVAHLDQGLVRSTRRVEIIRMHPIALSNFTNLQKVTFKAPPIPEVCLEHPLDVTALRQTLEACHLEPQSEAYDYGRSLIVPSLCRIYCTKSISYRLCEHATTWVDMVSIQTPQFVFNLICIEPHVRHSDDETCFTRNHDCHGRLAGNS